MNQLKSLPWSMSSEGVYIFVNRQVYLKKSTFVKNLKMLTEKLKKK